VVGSYPITVVKGSKYPDVASAFIAYVLSAAGQATLAAFGFQHA
jgi:ABC-type Fe3+ transport system substrate-binding protein